MLTVKDVKNIEGDIFTLQLPSDIEREIDCQKRLTLLPALIDAHVHFRTPGHEHKENWESASLAAVSCGITTVCDMPNNNPPCINLKSLIDKKDLIEKQLKNAKIPLRYHLWLGACPSNMEEINKIKTHVIGIKLYMGSTTGTLLMNDNKNLEKLFQIAAREDIIIAIHAEDNNIIKERKKIYGDDLNPKIHSHIRSKKAAVVATKQAIGLAEKYGARIIILHVSTKDELELIREAKKRGVHVFAEACPHHLFLTVDDYEALNSLAIVNPPLRTKEDSNALMNALLDGTIDTIGSDHAPHTIKEKMRPPQLAAAGVPGIETVLPLLLNAYNEKKISLEKIVELTSVNQTKILKIPKNDDVVLVDLEKKKQVKNGDLKTKAGWSPFSGKILQGWPVYTILRGQVYVVANL